jgi:glutamine cyclotransferase
MIRVFKPVILNILPHNSQSFTQGLFISNHQLYESTGLYGRSSLRQIDLSTGNTIRSQKLYPQLFGEGLAVLNSKIYQLTWLNKICLVWNQKTLNPIGHFPISGEGWGLTTDGLHLISSDGSSTLSFYDPSTQTVVKKIRAHFQSNRSNPKMTLHLNALQWVQGKIYANLYPSDQIAIINPRTGRIEALLDLATLNQSRSTKDAVCNGIAYDRNNDRLYVTGKLWPQLYEIKRPNLN